MQNYRHSLVPSATVTAGRVVKRTGAAGCETAADPTIAGGEVPVGVAEEGGEAGVPCPITLFGPAKARAGGVITPGTHLLLSYDANGKLVAAAAGDQVVALFMGAVAAADGQEIDVFMLPGLLKLTAANVPIVDTGTLYTATQTEAALAEVMTKLNTFISDLASVANTKGASKIAIEDVGTLYTAAQVEAALAEVMTKTNKIRSGEATLGAGGAVAVAVGAAWDGKPSVASLKTTVKPGHLVCTWDGNGTMTITSSDATSTDKVCWIVDGR